VIITVVIVTADQWLPGEQLTGSVGIVHVLTRVPALAVGAGIVSVIARIVPTGAVIARIDVRGVVRSYCGVVTSGPWTSLCRRIGGHEQTQSSNEHCRAENERSHGVFSR